MASSNSKSVGVELAAVLPKNDKHWWKKPNLIFLNFCLASLFLLSSGNGYEGSMMNGLLALPRWMSFVGEPKGAWLGFISGAQNIGSMAFYQSLPGPQTSTAASRPFSLDTFSSAPAPVYRRGPRTQTCSSLPEFSSAFLLPSSEAVSHC